MYKRVGPRIAALLVVLLVAGCDSWDRTTFNSLAAAKAAIDQAAVDYNAGLIPRSQEAKDLIEKARGVQSFGVHSFDTYAVAKVAGTSKESVAASRAIVVQAMVQLPALVVELQALLDKFHPGWHAEADVRERAIRAQYERRMEVILARGY